MMATTRLKVVTKCAREASRICTMRPDMKRSFRRAYRRQVRMTDHADETANYEPRRRLTGWVVA